MGSWRIPPDPIPAEKIISTVDADIVVAGLGYAGTAAFRAAAEAGSDVVAIEKQHEDCFTTWGHDIGHINSRFLAGRGVPHVDEIDYFNEWMRRASGRANPELIMRFVKNSGSAFDWYIDSLENTDYIKVAFWPSGSKFDGEISGYRFWPGTAEFIPPKNELLKKDQRPPKEEPHLFDKLMEGKAERHQAQFEASVGRMLNLGDLTRENQKKGEALGGKVFWGIEAMQLVKTGDRVTGLIGRDRDGKYHLYNARRGVILASGGFGGNREMVEELVPDMQDLYEPGDGSRKYGNGRDGRSIQMGVWAGGRLEAGQMPTMGGNFHTLRGINGTFGSLWLNPYGKRYCNETFGDPVIAGMPGNQVKRGTFYNIIDSNVLEDLQWAVPAHEGYDNSLDPEGTMLKKTLSDALAAGKGGMDIRAPGGKIHIAGGWNMEELLDNAELSGTVRENVKASILRYNQLCRNGRDEDFGKDAKLLRPLDQWPLFIQFHKYENRMLCTVGGLLTDGNQNVLDHQFEPIPGLYATGNCCGRRFGPQYSTPTSGVSIGIAITLGREAGKDAVRLG